LAETLFFAYLVNLSLGFDTRFYGHFIFRYSTLIFPVAALLFLYICSALLRRRPHASFMSSVLFVWALIWLVIDTFNSELRVWQELSWAIIPTVGLAAFVRLRSEDRTPKEGLA
jgi:hypothetical protein